MISHLNDLGEQAASKVSIASIHRSVSPNEKELCELAMSCKRQAVEVQAILDEMNIQGSPTM